MTRRSSFTPSQSDEVDDGCAISTGSRTIFVLRPRGDCGRRMLKAMGARASYCPHRSLQCDKVVSRSKAEQLAGAPRAVAPRLTIWHLFAQ